MQYKCFPANNYRKINSLTGARFFAILIIVFSHFEFLEKYGEFGIIYSSYIHNPTMGVDFFFMLSGFGMMISSIIKDPACSKSVGGLKGMVVFGIKHIKKIYAPYVFSLLLGIPYYCLTCGDFILIGLAKCAVYFSVDLTLFQSATGIMAFSHSLNGVCWFFSSLFCIYLLSPIILKLLKIHIKSAKVAIVGIFVSILISFILLVLFRWVEAKTFLDVLSYVSPIRRVFYVIPGMLMAQVFVFFKNNKQKKTLRLFKSGAFEYITICNSVIWFFFRNTISSKIGPYVVFLDMILVCCYLYALAIGNGIFSYFFSNKIVVYLGSISMYIFLFHYVIRMYVDYIVRSIGIESLAIGLFEVFIILFSSFILSSLIFYFKNKRTITNLSKKEIPPKKKR